MATTQHTPGAFSNETYDALREVYTARHAALPDLFDCLVDECYLELVGLEIWKNMR